MGGGERGNGDWRAKVWSMPGLPNCRPKHWRRNTAIALLGCFLICIPVAIKSAQLEVMQGLAKSIAWDGEGATCLIEVSSTQLRDDLLSMLVAGHESTASVLTWTVYLLSKNPSSLSKAKEEVDRVLQGQSPTYENTKELKFLMRCIIESLRLYPHPPVLLRRAQVDDTLHGGYKVNPGQDVMISVYNIHHSSQAEKPAALFGTSLAYLFTFRPQTTKCTVKQLTDNIELICDALRSSNVVEVQHIILLKANSQVTLLVSIFSCLDVNSRLVFSAILLAPRFL